MCVPSYRPRQAIAPNTCSHGTPVSSDAPASRSSASQYTTGSGCGGPEVLGMARAATTDGPNPPTRFPRREGGVCPLRSGAAGMSGPGSGGGTRGWSEVRRRQHDEVLDQQFRAALELQLLEPRPELARQRLHERRRPRRAASSPARRGSPTPRRPGRSGPRRAASLTRVSPCRAARWASVHAAVLVLQPRRRGRSSRRGRTSA